MSNVGKWTPWYADGAAAPTPYGDETTYRLAGEWLKDLYVEDWGCGFAWFKNFVDPDLYTGIDGTAGYADRVEDLVEYRPRPKPAGILLRHVLEHNAEWAKILENALASAEHRLAIIVFTPDGEGEQIAWNSIDVPDVAVPWDTISERLTAAEWEFTQQVLQTGTQYGVESVWLASRA